MQVETEFRLVLRCDFRQAFMYCGLDVLVELARELC